MRHAAARVGFLLAGLLFLFIDTPGAGQELTGKPWIDMDYGPFLTASIEVGGGNIAYKGIAVRLDDGPGGVSFGRAFMVFDTDTLRMAGGWVGEGFIDWRNVLFDGSHGTHPAVVGNVVFSNGPGPGWAHPQTGNFADDSRVLGRDGRRYGPLPRDHAHWRGLYRHGNKVVLHYTVGTTPVYELPGVQEVKGVTWLTRTIEIGPHRATYRLRIMDREEGQEFVAQTIRAGNGWWVHTLAPRRQEIKRQPEKPGWLRFDGQTFLEVPVEQVEKLRYGETDLTIIARIRPDAGGTVLALTPPDDSWRRDGKTFFLRGGHLVFDICDVGQCVSRERVSSGTWHTVAMTWSRSEGMVRMYIDGRPVQLGGRRRLVPFGPVRDYVLRIGRTSRQFPRGIPLNFDGDVDWIAVFDARLSDEEVANIGEQPPQEATLLWDFEGDEVAKETVAARKPEGVIALVRHDQAARRRIRPVIAVLTREESSPFETEGAHLLLELGPRNHAELVLVGYGVAEEGRSVVDTARLLSAPRAPSELTRGGPPLWARDVVTNPGPTEKRGSFDVIDLKPPYENPWRSWLRFGGLDFMTSSPDRLIVCNWQGDVWQVDGLEALDSDQPRLRWRRIASGLFQPLGLKVVDDTIYVLGRDQITILRDLNGDGETDFYENFNNDHQVTEHFHEFAMDLQLGPDGNFYYTKGGRHALDAVVPQHGTLLKVTPDGSNTEIVAWGFRAPNGLGISPKGEFVVSDQQGHWTPANRINYVRPGRFYGYMWAYHPGEPPQTYEPPLCWLPQDTDRSPAEQLWVEPTSWGPLHGHLLSLSYGTGKVFVVAHEVVGDVAQGGVTELPLEFATGIMRGRFHPRTDDLYICGLFGWSSNKTQPGGLYRVRYRGGPLHVPVSLQCYEDGLVLTFSDPLDRATVENPRNYFLEQWNYRWAARYGSDQWKVSNPTEQGHDTVPILDSILLEDGKSVFLRLERLQPVMQMRLNYNLKGSDGTIVRNRFDFTVNAVRKLPERLARRLLRPVSTEVAAVRRDSVQMGVRVDFRSLGADRRTDTRVDRLLALYVGKGEAPTPFLQPGPFEAEFTAYLQVTEPGLYRFGAVGIGHCEIAVGDSVVWSGDLVNDYRELRPGTTVELAAGFVPLRVRYRSAPEGAARLRVYWQSDRFHAEPIPPTALYHTPDREVLAGALLRRGRELYGLLRCNKCHGPVTLETGLPELQFDAPSLARAGDRLQAEWIARWVLDPRGLRHDARMPRLLDGPDAESVAVDIAAYLVSLRSAGARKTEIGGDREAGAQLWVERGCVACHRLEHGEDRYSRVALVGIQQKFTPFGLAEYLQSPVKSYTWNPMPDFKLAPDEVGQLAAFLWHNSPTLELPEMSGNGLRGRELVRQYRCAACHDFGEANADVRPRASLIPLGNPAEGCQAVSRPDGKGKPAYDLSNEDRAALTHWLRAGRPGLERHVPAEFAHRAIERLRCTACHRLDGRGGTLRTVLVEEQLVDNIPPPLPELTWVGEKLQATWVKAFLDGSLPYRPRPWLSVRMPCFPAYAEKLAAGLAAQHGYAPDYRNRIEVDEELADTGSRLIRLQGGFNCVQCHGIGNEPPTAPFENRGVNLSIVRERLTEEFFYRWLRNPVRIDPGTKMPLLVGADGTSPVKHVFGGNAVLQFEAIWHFLHSRHVRPPRTPEATAGGE